MTKEIHSLSETTRKSSPIPMQEPHLKCEVCQSPVSTYCDERLCWICRRLKISAWRDSDLQPAPAQE